VIDGDVLPEPVLARIEAGAAAGVSALIGTMLDEMRLFTAFDPSMTVTDEAELVQRAVAVFGSEERAAAAVATYRRTRPESTPGDIWAAVLTDQVFRMPAVRLAERQRPHADQTWMYLFTWAKPAFDGRLGSCHALEIPFVFNTLDAPGASMFTGAVTAEMRALAERMQDAWIAFARSGDPNTPGLPAWERYGRVDRATMLLGSTCITVNDPYGDELRAWDGVP
jgi:para-nitrobenzyl esterase